MKPKCTFRDWFEALVVLACMVLVVWRPHPEDLRKERPAAASPEIAAHLPAREDGYRHP